MGTAFVLIFCVNDEIDDVVSQIIDIHKPHTLDNDGPFTALSTQMLWGDMAIST